MEYYVDVVNYAQRSGDTKRLAELEGDECVSCRNAREFIDGVYSRGGRIVGGDFAITVLQALPNPAWGDWLVSGGLRFAPQTVTDPGAQPTVERLKGGKGLGNFFPGQAKGAWVMANWSRG